MKWWGDESEVVEWWDGNSSETVIVTAKLLNVVVPEQRGN